MAVYTKLSRNADGVDEKERRKVRLEGLGCVASLGSHQRESRES